MGSSGGTTEVMIMQQCSRSFQRERPSSCSPWCNTCAAAARAKTRRKRMNTSTSLVLPVARCDEKRMVRMSAPWLDWKAVRTWVVGKGESRQGGE